MDEETETIPVNVRRREDYCVDVWCFCHRAPWSFTLECCDRCFRHGPKPLTIVPPTQTVSLQEMADRVLRTREQHGDLLQRYHEVWYNSGHTWPYTHFLGVGLMKNPNDLWIYQAVMTELRPTTIIETGTYQGGSALWFAFLMDALGIDGGRIFTVDIDDHLTCTHPRIVALRGSSVDPQVAAAIGNTAKLDGPVLVSLDADHSAAHVRRELELYAPMTKIGDLIVVEDTNIGWTGADGDRGARGGVEDYLAAHPCEFAQDILCERYLLTMNPGGWLRRVAECTHG